MEYWIQHIVSGFELPFDLAQGGEPVEPCVTRYAL
jgi:hypothetical protein